ncbi:hypothetical protein [Rhizobium oryzicola]|uniref:Uncharacterized protein n=1 Tax=Rhizobium oryzicola TaxID=1232668 RepID=A0ABT8SWI1_9HYPH|nr:hypothetical protein [Rhizobium oryzicola]MDO1582514.1 hypothetical protein [Rhizobium oryzicola]
MKTETEILCASANALASAAMVTSLLGVLVQKGVLSPAEEQAVYAAAMDMLDENAEDDPQGIFELARDLVEQQRDAIVGEPAALMATGR